MALPSELLWAYGLFIAGGFFVVGAFWPKNKYPEAEEALEELENIQENFGISPLVYKILKEYIREKRKFFSLIAQSKERSGKLELFYKIKEHCEACSKIDLCQIDPNNPDSAEIGKDLIKTYYLAIHQLVAYKEIDESEATKAKSQFIKSLTNQ